MLSVGCVEWNMKRNGKGNRMTPALGVLRLVPRSTG